MHQPLRLSVARLWFRRWSRSRAAVFHSLGTAVMIGRLSSSVLDSLARKSRTLAVESEARGEVSYQAKHEGEDEEPLFYTTVYNWQALYTPALGLSNNQHSASPISMIDDAYITYSKGAVSKRVLIQPLLRYPRMYKMQGAKTESDESILKVCDRSRRRSPCGANVASNRAVCTLRHIAFLGV